MKNFTRKLLVSIIAVAFAFVAMGTSTYAWFTMNKEVTATGMQITAKSDNIYLIIGSGEVNTVEKLEAIDTAANKKTTAITVSNDQAKVLPAAHKDKLTAATIAEVGNWYTMDADDVTASTSTGEETALVADTEEATGAYEFSKYVIKRTVYMTLAEGSVDSGALTVSLDGFNVKAASGNDADNDTIVGLRLALAVTYDGTATKVIEGKGVDAAGEAAATIAFTDNVLLTSMSQKKLVKVDIYLYIDGADNSVYVNNIENLAGAAFTLKFNVVSAQ